MLTGGQVTVLPDQQPPHQYLDLDDAGGFETGPGTVDEFDTPVGDGDVGGQVILGHVTVDQLGEPLLRVGW